VTMTFKPLIKKYIGVIIFPRPTHLWSFSVMGSCILKLLISNIVGLTDRSDGQPTSCCKVICSLFFVGDRNHLALYHRYNVLVIPRDRNKKTEKILSPFYIYILNKPGFICNKQYLHVYISMYIH
jgi:hypothetical protein